MTITGSGELYKSRAFIKMGLSVYKKVMQKTQQFGTLSFSSTMKMHNHDWVAEKCVGLWHLSRWVSRVYIRCAWLLVCCRHSRSGWGG